MDEQTAADLQEVQDSEWMRASGWWPGQEDIASASAAGSGFASTALRTPLMELIEKEESADDERRRIQIECLTLLIQEALGSNDRRPDVVDVGLTILMWAWNLQIPPLDQMTQEQVGELAAQGRAAISARLKRKITKKLEAAGAKGTRSQRQKRSSIVEVYAESAMGNKNRSRAAAREKLTAAFGMQVAAKEAES